MKVNSTGIINGRISDEYGQKGTQFTNGMPSYSLPFTISDSPVGTKSYAVIFDDDDAVTACGFTWVHWLISDLKKTEVGPNESLNSDDFKQGVNSWNSCAADLTREQASIYGGPAPPNGKHLYTLKVFALDCELGLDNGFRLNELKRKMDGHVIAHAKIIGSYDMSV